MGDLAGLQRALDVYAASAYWKLYLQSGVARAQCESLREAAALAGCSAEQLTDADFYARQCFLRGRRPMEAGVSFEDFQRRFG